MIPTDLFDFAFVPAWFEQLYELSLLAAPEPWQYIKPEYETQNLQTPILERYINQVFRKQSIEYNYASAHHADSIFYIRNEFCCLHTGLYTPQYKDIYMCFERNKRLNTAKKWYFKGFATDDSPWLKYVRPLPRHPAHLNRRWVVYFNPEWEIRVNVNHILCDDENVARLPKSLGNTWNMPLLLEAAVELARRKAICDWGIVVPQIFQGRIQYLLPIHLTNMERPDLAMALSVMDGYYIGHTCLTMAMAYQNARMLGRPTAKWLADLVSRSGTERKQDA